MGIKDGTHCDRMKTTRCLESSNRETKILRIQMILGASLKGLGVYRVAPLTTTIMKYYHAGREKKTTTSQSHLSYPICCLKRL